MTRPAKITWAAAALLFASGIASALGIFALSVPGADRTVSIVVLAIGVWGIAMGAGLFRLWRWARISALIAGGFSAYVGFTLMPMAFFTQVPVPPELSEQVTTEVSTEIAMRIKIAVIIALLLFAAIGFWWAYLFSSRPIKELFGDPTTGRARPFMFSVVGWYFVISAIFGMVSFWQGVRHGPPIRMEFGSLMIGWSAFVVTASYFVVQLFLGSGLLRGRELARKFAIYYLSFELLNIIVFFLRPGREARIIAYHDMLVASHPTFDMYFSSASWSHFMRVASMEWAIFALITIWFFARQNSRWTSPTPEIL